MSKTNQKITGLNAEEIEENPCICPYCEKVISCEECADNNSWEMCVPTHKGCPEILKQFPEGMR